VTIELIEDTNLNLLWISKNCLQKFITYNITLILIESDAFANVQKKIFFDRKQITHSNLKKSKTTDKIVTNLNQRLSIGLSCIIEETNTWYPTVVSFKYALKLYLS